MEILGPAPAPATATATARTAAIPGRRNEDTLRRGRSCSYGFFGDGNPRLTSDLAMAAGAAPRLAAVRCTRRANASNPFISAAPARARARLTATGSLPPLPAAQDFCWGEERWILYGLNNRKIQGTTRCGMKPPPETPRSIAPVMKLLSELAKEALITGKFLWQWTLYVWSRPEIENLWLKMVKIVRRIVLKILYAVVSATNEPSAIAGTTCCGMKPPPETPRSFTVVKKLTIELTMEAVMIARFLWYWAEFIWSMTLVRMVHGLVSTTNDPSSNEATERASVSMSNRQAKQGPAGTSAPSKSPPPPGTERNPVSKASPQTEQASEEKTTQPFSRKQPHDPWSKAGKHERNPMSKASPETEQVSERRTSQPIDKQQTQEPRSVKYERNSMSKPSTETEQNTSQLTSKEQPHDLWSKALKQVKKTVNRNARELIGMIIRQNLLKLKKELYRKFITVLLCNLALWTSIWALKEITSQPEMAVACQLFAVRCWKAVLAYNLQEKLVVAGEVMRGIISRAGEAFQELEKSYKISKKVVALWDNVEMTGKRAENFSTTWVKIENVYNIFLKLTKGPKGA